MSEQKKLYFTAGPAKIPKEVMQQVHDELFDYRGLGIGVMEMSHRSKEFTAIIEETEANLRKLVGIPDNYSVLFMHGGAKSQFESVPMNLCSEPGKFQADYLISGSWSKIAVKDAEKYVHCIKQGLKIPAYTREPAPEELKEYDDVNYRYYCDNETIQGIEFSYVPQCKNNKIPLVCDMTSNFLSRPIDVSKFGIIFAGTQKNCGISGLAIVIVRNDLIGKHMTYTPELQRYEVMKKEKSVSNTPATFAIYVANLCIKWAIERGGLKALDQFSKDKSQILYDVIDSGTFYSSPIEKTCRSRMNVVFLLTSKDLESKFLEKSREANLFELKGHRSVGGFRASLYNGVTIEDVKRLASFMIQFENENKKADG